MSAELGGDGSGSSRRHPVLWIRKSGYMARSSGESTALTMVRPTTAALLASSTFLEASLWSSIDIMTNLALRMKIFASVFRSGRRRRLRRDLLGGITLECRLEAVAWGL